MLFFIICNTITMAMYTHDQSDEEKAVIATFDQIFDIVFILEMFLKWCGLGFKSYWRDSWNVFDAVIVFSSILNIIVFSIWHEEKDLIAPLEAVFTAL